MTSWTHQLMSQGNQVVETNPGHSQKHFTVSETVNLTEQNVKGHTKGTTGNTNDGNITSLGSLLGVPVKLSNGMADKNNNQTYTH